MRQAAQMGQEPVRWTCHLEPKPEYTAELNTSRFSCGQSVQHMVAEVPVLHEDKDQI